MKLKIKPCVALYLAGFLIPLHYFRRPSSPHLQNENPAPERSFSNEVQAGNSTLDMRTIVLLPAYQCAGKLTLKVKCR
jgi:hypothetical protein